MKDDYHFRQYQSRRETSNTIKGFLVLVGFVIGVVSLLHVIAYAFAP